MTDLTHAAIVEMARRRLERFKALDEKHGTDLNERGVKLLRHAAFEAYQMLADLEDTRRGPAA